MKHAKRTPMMSRTKYPVIAVIVIVCIAFSLFIAAQNGLFSGIGASSSTLANSTQGTARVVDSREKATLSNALPDGAGKIAVLAKRVDDASGYEFAVSTNDGFTRNVKFGLSELNSSAIPGLNPCQNYYVKVRAYWDTGNTRRWSAWSDPKLCKTAQVKIALVDKNPSLEKGAGGWLYRNGCNVVPLETSDIDPDDYDGLLIPGGGDVSPDLYGKKKTEETYSVNRDLDLMQIEVVKDFEAKGKPIIGICRGSQIINTAFGGTLFQHIEGWHNGYRKVIIKPNSWLYGLYGSSEETFHYHHQCVEELGDGLVATEWDAQDGRIEAIQHESLPIYGLQWHPERMHAQQDKIANAFIRVCIDENR